VFACRQTSGDDGFRRHHAARGVAVTSAPVRRLLAFALDYLVIAAYLLVLLGVSLAILASSARSAYLTVWSNAWSAELAGLILLTAPVVLYFAVLESSPAGATLGKRVLHLRVVKADGSRLDFGRSLLRSAIKLLPWELAHFTIWHYVFGSAGHASPPAWAAVALAVVYLLVAAFLVTLFVGREHRTIYDRIAGSRVVVGIRDVHP
jgi:uncharacterized RDD family membrane protein YckC